MGIAGSLCCLVSAYLVNTEVSFAQTPKRYLILALKVPSMSIYRVHKQGLTYYLYDQPAHTKQTLKRLHRKGQIREVYVYRLTCADESIQERATLPQLHPYIEGSRIALG